MEKLIDITKPPIAPLLPLLLADKTTQKNIIWATDTYAALGYGFSDKEQMTPALLLASPDLIRPRIEKSEEQQAARTRKKAEVFTPAWLCNEMNNVCDTEYFGKSGVFNVEKERGWETNETPVAFPPQGRRKIPLWQRYIDSRRLEIACGEAPYLTSRYDAATGAPIAVKDRVGQLDRKLRVVSENAETKAEWQKWALRALEACYGYEYQGDSLLLARANILLALAESCEAKFGAPPGEKFLQKAANRIAWNLWQMDGKKDTVPLGKPYSPVEEFSLFAEASEEKSLALPCRIFDWRRQRSLVFRELKNNH